MPMGNYYNDSITFNWRCDMTKYEVQEYCLCGGWTNTWSDDDGPTRFDTRESAQAALDAFLEETQHEVDAGNLEDYTDREDFQIVEVTV
jgi:hypothetical protein